MQIPPKKSIELEKLAKNKIHCKSSIENLKYRLNIKFQCNKTCVCKNMGQWHQMHLAALPKVAKTTKKQRRGTLSLFVPSAICGLIDVDALDPAFSTDGFDGSRRISWQWIKCNLARLARRP